METSLIEKYDRSRFNLLIGATIGWGLWYGLKIVLPYITNKTIKLSLVVAGMIGFILVVVSLIKIMQIKRILRKNPQLGNILNNEWVVHTKRQAITVGYWCMLVAAAVGTGITEFIAISGLLLMQIMLYIGILSMLITHLILLRDR